MSHTPSVVSMSFLAVLLVAGCAVAPYSGKSIDENTISFSGLTDVAGVRVRLSAYDWNASRFLPMVDVFATTEPAFPAGSICPNSPALYLYDGSISLIWPFFWRRLDGSPYQTKVRATQITSADTPLLFTSNPSGPACMQANAFNTTCDFYVVAHTTCGYQLNEAIVFTRSSSPWI